MWLELVPWFTHGRPLLEGAHVKMVTYCFLNVVAWSSPHLKEAHYLLALFLQVTPLFYYCGIVSW
jgi:hypothetical protein